MAPRMALALLLLAVAPAATEGSAVDTAINPVRKVVTLLQKMQKAVQAEGEKEKELFEKFKCYCKTGSGTLQQSISAAEAKIPEVAAQIKSSQEEKAQVEADLERAQADLKDAKATMAETMAKREKEAAEFATLQADYVANIGACMKAVAALERGMVGAFMQTSAMGTLKKLVSNDKVNIGDEDRQELMSFLSGTGPFSQGYSASSGQVVGLLKQLGDQMASALAAATHEEEKAIHSYNALMSAKKEEADVLTKKIEDKIQKTGELAVSIAQMINDHGDTAEALAEDRQFLANLEKSCATKQQEWDERCKTRAAELLALAETIKILNDDDALELFKKTLPGASFVQTGDASIAQRQRAYSLIQRVVQKQDSEGNGLPMKFIMLALEGKKIGFEKVIAMIDQMVATLKKEQQDDDGKREYCASELDTSDDKKKSIEQTISDTEAAIAAAKDSIATLTDDIAALKKAITDLDKSVASATQQRKDENAEFKELMSANSAAKQLLQMAENRLNQFYNPKLYKPPAKKERSSMERISQEVGGAFVQIAQRKRLAEAPPPPPETFGAYQKKGEEHGGVVQMMRLLIKDLDIEMAEAETQERDSQGDYEELMRESAAKRAADSKTLADKEGAKANMEGDLQSHSDTLKEAKRDLGATLEYIHSLHVECDWLLKYYDVRKDARASELDSLGKAKAVLSGADFSLLQSKVKGFLPRSH